MHRRFPPITLGAIHRWDTALLAVARRETLDQTPPWSPLPILSPAERNHYHTLPPWRRREWAAGRDLAKHLVAGATGTPLTEVEILPREDGSPQLLIGAHPETAPHLSISHTEHHVAAALASDPVGIDVCELTSAVAVGRAADHILTPGERPVVTDHPASLTAAWALKEAAVKADRRTMFSDAPRQARILGLTPPVLDGGRRALLRHTGSALVAVVVAPRR